MKKWTFLMITLIVSLALSGCAQTPAIADANETTAPTATKAPEKTQESASPEKVPETTPDPTQAAPTAEPGETPFELPKTAEDLFNDFYGWDGSTWRGPDLSILLAPTEKPEMKSGEASGDLYWIFGEEPAKIDVNGKTYEIVCTQRDEGEYGASAVVKVRTPENKELTWVSEPISYLSSCAAMIAENGDLMLLVSSDVASDDFYTTVLRVSAASIDQSDEIHGRVILCDDAKLLVEDHLYLLGTRPFRRTYAIGENGLPVNPSDYELGLGQSVTVADGVTLTGEAENGEPIEFTAGTELKPLLTDYDTYIVVMDMESQTIAEIEIFYGDWGFEICGMDEDEAFSDLMWSD